MQSLQLSILPETLGVCRMTNDEPIPSWSMNPTFLAITRTPDELSIVCPERNIPEDIQAEVGWYALKVMGSLDFALVGILAGLSQPLARAGIPIFVISTYDTDYLLIKSAHFKTAIQILNNEGHQINQSKINN